MSCRLSRCKPASCEDHVPDHSHPTAPNLYGSCSKMGALERLLKIHTDNGGDLRSVPTKLFNDALYSDQSFTNHELEIMYMLVCQKKDYNKKSPRVTTLPQLIITFERGATSSRSDDTESELSIYAELRAEERKLWRRIAGPSTAKTTSKEEQERLRRIHEPSLSPEVDVRKRKW